jgi:putative flavoprotein involved in K+ transport
VQVAEELAEAGRRVWLATSFVGRGPRRYRGNDLFDWMARAGLLRQTIDDLENPAEAKATQPQISGTKGGHTVGLQSLARQGVTLLGGVENIDGAVVQLRGNLLENAEFGDAFSTRIKGMVDQAVAQMGADAPPAEPDPAEAPFEGLPAMAERRALDLEAENVGSVVWATGFGGDFSWLDLPALDDDGTPVHDGGVSSVAGLYFVGFPWLRTRGSGLIAGVEADARHVVDHLVARR